MRASLFHQKSEFEFVQTKIERKNSKQTFSCSSSSLTERKAKMTIGRIAINTKPPTAKAIPSGEGGDTELPCPSKEELAGQNNSVPGSVISCTGTG